MPKITVNNISIDPQKQAAKLKAFRLVREKAEDSNYILIQTYGPLMREQRDLLLSKVDELLEYVPEDTYIARYEAVDLAPVRKLKFVKWVNSYWQGFKLARDVFNMEGEDSLRIMKRAEENPIRDFSFMLVDICFHRGANSIETQERVVRAAGLDDRNINPLSEKIRAYVSINSLRKIARIDEVRHIEKVYEPKLNNDVALKLINALSVHHTSVGLRGDGQVLAICDSGVDKGSFSRIHPALKGRVIGFYGLARPGDASDPNGHGTHIAGSLVGEEKIGSRTIKGVAPGAKLVVQSISDERGKVSGLPDNLKELFFTPHKLHKAHIHNNSWTEENNWGKYSTYSCDIDTYVWDCHDLVICCAVGNTGRDLDSNEVVDNFSIEPPSTAKNCISVGASENKRPNIKEKWKLFNYFPKHPPRLDRVADDPHEIAAISGRGPTIDGRIKPDLVAPGTSVLSTQSSRASVNDDWGEIPTNRTLKGKYHYMGGTSMACAFVSGCAAIVRQSLMDKGHKSPSAALIKALLINGAEPLRERQTGTRRMIKIPNYDQGFGRVNLERSILSNKNNLDIYEEGRKLEAGESEIRNLDIPAGTKYSKITLVWTDRPGAALENDLDLIVRNNGRERHGNMDPRSTKFDRKNNVEQVIWPNVNGNLQIVVHAHRTPFFAQDYALVVRFE